MQKPENMTHKTDKSESPRQIKHKSSFYTQKTHAILFQELDSHHWTKKYKQNWILQICSLLDSFSYNHQLFDSAGYLCSLSGFRKQIMPPHIITEKVACIIIFFCPKLISCYNPNFPIPSIFGVTQLKNRNHDSI